MLNPNILKVEFPSSKIVEYSKNTSILKIIKDEEFKNYEETDLLAVKVNGRIASLNSQIVYSKCNIKPVLMNSYEGLNVYQNSLCFLLSYATFLELKDFKHSLIVEHQLNHGYQCTLNLYENGHEKEKLVSNILKRMVEIVKLKMLIEKKILSHEEAVDYFEKNEKRFSVELIKSLNDPDVYVNSIVDEDTFFTLFHYPLVAHTGQIGTDFDLVTNDYGILLKVSSRSNYIKMDYFNNSLVPVYRDSIDWGIQINMKCVGQLNRAITEKKGIEIKQFIALCETLHYQKINEIAATFIDQYKKNNKKRLILIAGPTASNKTTFAKKLCLQLRTSGINPVVLSVDDYYKPVSECPEDEKGNKDFERIEALRVDLLNQHLEDLFNGKSIESPLFDFLAGKPKKETTTLQLGQDSILVMEGIHCLNDKLTISVDKSNKFKIFIAPFSQLNIDENVSVWNSVNRLLRRMIRDFKTRGHSPSETLKRWPSIRKSEHQYVFPFMDEADFVFNSSLDYEFSVLKGYLMPLLFSIPPESNCYNHVRELLDFFNHFYTLSDEFIPNTSLIREFIGGSFFD